MSDSSTPNDSNSSEEPARPKLSLRKDKTPSPSENEEQADSNHPEKKQDSVEETTQKRPAIKLSVKRSAEKEDATIPSGSESTAKAAIPPVPEPPQSTGPTPEPETPAPRKIPLRLKGEPPAPSESESPEVPSPAATIPPFPKDKPSSTEKIGSEDEEAIDDALQEEPKTTKDEKYASGLSQLPFNIPETIGDDPPPVPGMRGKTQIPFEQEEEAGITLEDLEPARASKPPPPPGAPVHKGKIRKKRSIGKVLIPILGLGVIGVGGFYAFAMFSGSEETSVPDSEPTKTSATTTPQPAQTSEIPIENVISSGELLIEAPEEAAEPVLESDPYISGLIEELEITMYKSTGANPVIVIGDVAFPPGSVIDPTNNIQFIGFSNDRREIMFQDDRGALYYRSY